MKSGGYTDNAKNTTQEIQRISRNTSPNLGVAPNPSQSIICYGTGIHISNDPPCRACIG